MASSSLTTHFHPSVLQKDQNIPTQFIWPKEELVQTKEELNEPMIDLAGFFHGDVAATAAAAEQLRAGCEKHGFFQVTNHGVDEELIRAAQDEMDSLFKLSVDKKVSLQKMPGSLWGYSGAHSDRFSSNLPWKEMFSFQYDHGSAPEELLVVDYFNNVVGKEFEKTGLVYQKYCEAMKKLSLALFQLLAISLGIDREHYKKFFEDGSSIMRCNYYPACNEPNLTLGTGPHCDPTSLTILHQDQVGGLEVFSNNKWQSVRPRPNTLVINIGDTFMALSNGRYKSCLHRAAVHKGKERRSMVYFVNPKKDKVVKPPQDLVDQKGEKIKRKYPDFTWSKLLGFTQKHYRADDTTLQSFCHWLLTNKD
uniref:Gibberellin 20-oxidase n=1 Tax=Panax quinquefolius TaxID=44588 RepID=A0A075M4D8_PANQU|nr:gibberellin 20-oxidase [Panax quinquefolius]